MRISDWSSDVCSSDLILWITTSAAVPRFSRGRDPVLGERDVARLGDQREAFVAQVQVDEGGHCRVLLGLGRVDVDEQRPREEIGRASCRERVCQYVSIWVVAVSLKKKKQKLSR